MLLRSIPRLSSFTRGRDNNFNLIRFIAALLVILSHSYPLTGNPAEPLSVLAGFTFGHLAVDIFFVTSGFLVSASLLKRSELKSFITSRIVRIYPALIVAVAFSAYIIGPLFTSLPLVEYLKSPTTHNFFIHNSLLVVEPIQFSLPGTFEHLPVKNSVNGSLWTLPWEVAMYAALTFLGIISLLTFKRLHPQFLKVSITSTAVLFTVVYFANHSTHLITGPHLPHMIRFAAMFFMGGAYYIYRQNIPLSKHLFSILLALVIISSTSPGNISFFIYSLALPYLLLYLSYIPTGFIRRFNQLGDYSYGLYIYAFPIQQSLVFLRPDIPTTTLFLSAFPLTLFLAMLSWHFVEKPSLDHWRKQSKNPNR